MKSNPLLEYAEAILVTFLWSSSYVLIKFGLLEIPPFLFAAVRYTLAFVVLGMLCIARLGTEKSGRKSTTVANGKALLVAAGICGYTLAQGLQFVGLFYLPAVMTTFVLNFTPIFVLVLGILDVQSGGVTPLRCQRTGGFSGLRSKVDRDTGLVWVQNYQRH
jgi:drug/metabolite transporter (DMT)-like permease